MKKLFGICAAAVLCMSAVGCNGKSEGGSSGKSGGAKSEENNASVTLDISDLDLSVDVFIDEEVVDGDRELVFWYTNNSDYTITYLELQCKLKDGITKEDLEKFDYDEFYDEGWDVDDISGKFEYGEDDGYEDGEPICVDSGESSSKKGGDIYGIHSMEEYENMQPDIMTIQYLDKDEKEHRINYDYKNDKYSEEEMD